jgi:hypothetical protein
MVNDVINVVMLGASRSGKTSILASMLDSVKSADKAIGRYFTLLDKSDYSNKSESERLADTIDEMKDMVATTQCKMVDLFGTQGQFNYQFEMDVIPPTSKKVKINFRDIPGEYLNPAKPEYEDLMANIRNSQILVIAVDTPALLYVDSLENRAAMNTVVNCTDAVYEAVINLGTEVGEDVMRMVIFVPIKCETWYDDMSDVCTRIKEIYANSIRVLQGYKNVNSFILPVKTIGGISFDHHTEKEKSMVVMYGSSQRNALYISEDSRYDVNGVLREAVRCERLNAGQVRLKNGLTYDLDKEDVIKHATEFANRYPYCYAPGKAIPYAWFRTTGAYRPEQCEQLLLQVMQFAIKNVEIASKYPAMYKLPEPEDTFFGKLKYHINKAWNRLVTMFNRGPLGGFFDLNQYKAFKDQLLKAYTDGLFNTSKITSIVNKSEL